MTPVARFDITGGTDGPDASDVILHQGGGLELADAAGTVALRDFRIDLPNQTVYANVTVNGADAGNVGVFTVGSDASLTLTSTAADVVATTLDAPAITPDVVIGTAAPSPEVGLDALLHQLGSQDGLQFLGHPAETRPIIGGETEVTLSSAATLTSLGVDVSPLGSATVDTSTPDPTALFPVTGGTVGPGDGVSVILHQGSGLELSSGSDQVSLRDLLIDTQNHVVDANVTVNGDAVGNVPVFDIGNDLTLNLTQQSATVLADTFGSRRVHPGPDRRFGRSTPDRPAGWRRLLELTGRAVNFAAVEPGCCHSAPAHPGTAAMHKLDAECRDRHASPLVMARP